MHLQQIHRLSAGIMVALSLLALAIVLFGYTLPPQTDEGAPAHLFQLSILAWVLTVLTFVATADWKRPMRSAAPLMVSVLALALAFGALYHLEHFFYR